MSWKKLKTFAIVLLLLMNAVFLFLILRREHLSTHYEDSLIDSAEVLFRESELYVDRAFLEQKRISLPVFSGDAVPTKSRELPAVRAIEREGFVLEDEPGGVRLENAVGEFYFADDFGFYYMEKGRYDRPSTLLRTERYILLTEDTPYSKNAIAVVHDFLTRYDFLSTENSRYGYEIDYSEVYSSGVNYIVTLSQSIDGVPVHEEICMMVSGGRVVSADGVFATAAPTSRKKAETVDLLELLFLEKAAQDEAFRKNGGFSYTPKVVSHVSYSYAVYFDADGSFYLVPLCEIAYAGGETRTYNCVSGALYAS